MASCRILVSVVAALSLPAAAQSTIPGYSFVDTPFARYVYRDSLEFLVPQAIQTFTHSYQWQRERFGWTPSEKPTLILADTADYGTAHAFVAPHLRIAMDVGPESKAFETATASERFYSTLNHELVHIAAGDAAGPRERAWRRFFGGRVALDPASPETILYSYLATPRFIVPRWWSEGAAVFMETWMSGGLGRAQGGYDEMVFRAMVRDNAPFYDPLGLISKGVRADFQVGVNAYLYGTRFFTWLALTQSPAKVVELLRRDEGSRPYYADQFELVMGMTVDDAWRQWIAFEQDFQRRNLAEVRKFPVTEHRPLANRALGSMSRVYFDEPSGTLYGGFRIPGVVDHIGALDVRTGSLRQLTDIQRAMLYRVTSFAFDPATRRAFYTVDNTRLRDLLAVNVDTGEVTRLMENARIGDIAFNPRDRSLLGVRHSRGLASLVRIPFPYDDFETLHEFPYETVPTDLDISPDGRLLSATVGEPSTQQFLRVWEVERLLEGDVRPLRQFDFGQSVPESFVFTRDGKQLYGSSYYTGVSNIFRYDIDSGDMTAVSNAETGYFRPTPLSDGRLLVLTYTGEGFVPVTIDPRPLRDVSAITFLGTEVATRHPVVTKWQVPVTPVDTASMITARGPYELAQQVTFESAYPVLQGYKNYAGLGYKFNFSDVRDLAYLSLTLAATPSNRLGRGERLHAELKGQYREWRGSIAHNPSDFYDLFGPTKRSRKGDALNIGYDQDLIYEPPREMTLKYDLKYRRGIDVLPEAQNVGVNFDKLLQGLLTLHYKDLKKSLGAVDEEKGVAWTLQGSGTRVNGKVIPQVLGDLSLGAQLPLAHASVWWHGAAGASSGDALNPVANFYFGGFGNNYVDSREVKRFRDPASMPGFEIDELSGQRFLKSTFEIDLPALNLESFGWPVIHATWVRPSAFTSMLWTDPGRPTHARFTSVGAQADVRFNVMHRSDVTLSFGYAVGFRGTRRASNEFMVSLKIL
jgi:hypothetical protein